MKGTPNAVFCVGDPKQMDVSSAGNKSRIIKALCRMRGAFFLEREPGQALQDGNSWEPITVRK